VSLPLGMIKKVDRGFKVERKYYHLVPGNKAIEPVEMDNLKSGELYLIKASSSVSALPKNTVRNNYYFVELDIPAGMAVVSEDREVLENYKLKTAPNGANRRVTPEKVRWYMTDEYHASGEFSVVVRAMYPGDYSAGVANAEDF